MEKRLEIVGEQVVYQQGNFRRLRRWIKGWHPELGQLIWGLTGPETCIECDGIPMRTFLVHQASSAAA